MNHPVVDVLSSGPAVIFPVHTPATRAASTPPITRRHFETLSDHLQDGVAFTDQAGRILYWNEAMAVLTGIPATTCAGKQWDFAGLNFTYTTSDGLEDRSAREQCPVTACLHSERKITKSMKIVVPDSGGQRGVRDRQSDGLTIKQIGRDVLVRITPVGVEHGGGAVIIVRDLSDHIEMQSQILSLHKKAMSDPLTGVANRFEFDQCLRRCTDESQQRQTIFSLIMCDIDHFKRVNDVHGHPAGDEALIQFANVLRRHTRSSDLVARYGGEEFVVVAANSDRATAMRRANEIRHAVASTPLHGIGGQSVTVSIGVAEYQNGDTPESIVARVDRALLRAKVNGRNRVE